LSSSVRDERRHNFFIVDNEVVMRHASELGPHGLAVYCALVCHAGGKGFWDGSMEYLAKELGMSRRGVLNVLEKLEEKELIQVERRRVGNNMKTTNTYRILPVEKDAADVNEVHNDVHAPDVNEVHINNTYLEQDVSKDVPNGTSKEAKPSSARRKVKKFSEEEAGKRWQQLTDSATHGESLRTLAEMLASENKTGEVAVTRVWRELGERYLRAREKDDLGDGAWAYGFDVAISNEAPNIGYVLKAARNYRPRREPASKGNGNTPPQATSSVKDGYEWLFDK
jgi:DNA-binding MarR family transcriptional regulator